MVETSKMEIYAVPGPPIILKMTAKQFEEWREKHKPSAEEYARLKADADFFAKHALKIRRNGWIE